MAAHALDRHVALVGFMGAGKSTVALEAGRRLAREVHQVDAAVQEAAGRTTDNIFDEAGEAEFRRLEEDETLRALDFPAPRILDLGGGAVASERVRDALRRRALTVWIDCDVDTAWSRVAGSTRPLARNEDDFRRLYDERRPLYAESADARAADADDVVLAAAGIHAERGALALLRDLVPGRGPIALVSEPHVLGIHGAEAQLGLGERLASTHELPRGEEAKTLAVAGRLWEELRLDRDATIVALGGGALTDAAGFVAATYLRGIDWIAVPSTLVGQVDAAIGGKTAIDLPQGKNLVGAFHWPVRTVIDPALLATLSQQERREGLAEVVKTGLLAGEELWELPEDELVRRCAAYKAAVCLRDPRERGERAVLNLGHTFAHALEAAAGYDGVTHGQAVALGLLAALRLSGIGTDVVERVLAPRPVRVDRERAWAALRRDKKMRSGKIRLVLLEAPGRPRAGAELPEQDVRSALDELIAE